jgi:hypothetical protein
MGCNVAYPWKNGVPAGTLGGMPQLHCALLPNLYALCGVLTNQLLPHVRALDQCRNWNILSLFSSFGEWIDASAAASEAWRIGSSASGRYADYAYCGSAEPCGR